jgi:triphosphatase
LHADIPLEIANDSKAARGYALLENRPPSAVKATPVQLKRNMRLEDSFRSIGLNCLQQMESNVPGVLKQSVESLHQMRVGLRRLRALLDMFGELASVPSQVRDGLDWLAGELGATRDWDVLANSTLDRIASFDSGEIKQLAATKANALHQDLLLSLHDPRYTQLLLQLNGWFHGRHWRNNKNFSKNTPFTSSVIDGMVPLLQKAQKRLVRRIDNAEQGDSAARHRIRIAAKKARYAAEFFTDLLPRRPIRKYISHLSHLQDRLGSLNDLEAAKQLLSSLDGEGSSLGTVFARGYVSAQLECGIPDLTKSLRSTRKLKMPIDR